MTKKRDLISGTNTNRCAHLVLRHHRIVAADRPHRIDGNSPDRMTGQDQSNPRGSAERTHLRTRPAVVTKNSMKSMSRCMVMLWEARPSRTESLSAAAPLAMAALHWNGKSMIEPTANDVQRGTHSCFVACKLLQNQIRDQAVCLVVHGPVTTVEEQEKTSRLCQSREVYKFNNNLSNKTNLGACESIANDRKHSRSRKAPVRREERHGCTFG